MSRLDHSLVSENFMDSFPNISYVVLERRWLDHCPLVLKEMVLDYGPTSFKFFNLWLEMEYFFDIVM